MFNSIFICIQYIVKDKFTFARISSGVWSDARFVLLSLYIRYLNFNPALLQDASNEASNYHYVLKLFLICF